MNEIGNHEGQGALGAKGDEALQSRILLVMAMAIVLAVTSSAPFAPWRVTAGLMLGGLLSLFNYHWLRSSIHALIQANVSNQNVGHMASRYVVRYVVVGAVVFMTYKLGLISLPATIIGLCSFVVALFAEALREFYFAIIRGEETN